MARDRPMPSHVKPTVYFALQVAFYSEAVECCLTRERKSNNTRWIQFEKGGPLETNKSQSRESG